MFFSFIAGLSHSSSSTHTIIIKNITWNPMYKDQNDNSVHTTHKDVSQPMPTTIQNRFIINFPKHKMIPTRVPTVLICNELLCQNRPRKIVPESNPPHCAKDTSHVLQGIYTCRMPSALLLLFSCWLCKQYSSGVGSAEPPVVVVVVGRRKEPNPTHFRAVYSIQHPWLVSGRGFALGLRGLGGWVVGWGVVAMMRE